MRKTIYAALIACLLLGVAVAAFAAGQDANALVDKGIAALGGQDKLSKIEAMEVTSKGTITFNGMDADISTHGISEGLDRYRAEFEGNFGGNEIKGVTVVDGDKGWRQFGGSTTALSKDDLANDKHNTELLLIPVTLVALKSKDFKIESIPDDKVGDKPVAGIKVTGPDKKEFNLYFDKDTGLPAKLVGKVVGFDGNEFTEEVVLSDYKDFGGIKKATKSVATRDGQKFIVTQLTDFKVMSKDKVDPKAFTEPA